MTNSRVPNNLIVLIVALLLLNGCVSSSKNGQTARNPFIFKSKKGEISYLKTYDKALALWPVPYEEVDIKTSFGMAHVIMSGPKNGAPIVLLHGMNASSTMWYPNIKAMAETYRVYAIDFILEPGKSVPDRDIADNEEVIIWYCEIFQHLKLDNINLIGASRGGWLTLNLALHSTTKDRIKNIVLLSPAQALKFIELKGKTISEILFFLSPKRTKLRKSLERFSCNVDKIKQAYIDQYFLATKTTKKNSSILQMTPFSKEQLQSVQMPVLLLIGDNDIINDKESIEKAKNQIPTVETDIISGAGHFLSIDQAEIVNKKILNFLNKNK